MNQKKRSGFLALILALALTLSFSVTVLAQDTQAGFDANAPGTRPSPMIEYSSELASLMGVAPVANFQMTGKFLGAGLTKNIGAIGLASTYKFELTMPDGVQFNSNDSLVIDRGGTSETLNLKNTDRIEPVGGSFPSQSILVTIFAASDSFPVSYGFKLTPDGSTDTYTYTHVIEQAPSVEMTASLQPISPTETGFSVRVPENTVFPNGTLVLREKGSTTAISSSSTVDSTSAPNEISLPLTTLPTGDTTYEIVFTPQSDYVGFVQTTLEYSVNASFFNPPQNPATFGNGSGGDIASLVSTVPAGTSFSASIANTGDSTLYSESFKFAMLQTLDTYLKDNPNTTFPGSLVGMLELSLLGADGTPYSSPDGELLEVRINMPDLKKDDTVTLIHWFAFTELTSSERGTEAAEVISTTPNSNGSVLTVHDGYLIVKTRALSPFAVYLNKAPTPTPSSSSSAPSSSSSSSSSSTTTGGTAAATTALSPQTGAI